MQTKEEFEDEGFINEYGRFIDNPRISDIIGTNTGCIMGFTHTFPNSSRQEEIIRETQSDSAGNLLPDNWEELLAKGGLYSHLCSLQSVS